MGGGGIYAAQGNVNVTGGQVIANNVTGVGGGICTPMGNVYLTAGAQVEQNAASGVGGGIFDIAAASTQGVNLTNATVAGNVSVLDGGGIYVTTGSVNVLDSTISGNIAEYKIAGGIEDADAKGGVNVTNSTIGGNSAQTSGGGIHAAGTATINNSTIALNMLATGGKGAGIQVKGAIEINNTIVAGNHAGTTEQDISGTAKGNNNVIADAASAGGLVNGTNSNIVGINGVGRRPTNTIINPTLANNGGLTETYALALDSVAIGTGDSALNPASVGNYDQRGPGYPRSTNGLMNIGAV
jgi:predicted outer membrane repeat protein